MRARLANKQKVTVRPLNGQSGDVFGDAPIVTSTTRGTSFRMPMQIMWTQGVLGDPSDPGREQTFIAIARILNRDIPPGAPSSWRDAKIGPRLNDLVELVSGRELFVVHARPAFPKSPRLGTPDGRWDGWDVRLDDSEPTMRAAGQYAS